MGIVATKYGSYGSMRLWTIPQFITLLDLSTVDAQNVEAENDVVVISVSMTIGSNTQYGVVGISDNTNDGTVYSSWSNYITDYLNGAFKTTHSLLGEFSIEDNKIKYKNTEGFATATLEPDYGVFGSAFGNEFD